MKQQVFEIEIRGERKAFYDDVPLSLSRSAWLKIEHEFQGTRFPFKVSVTFSKNEGGWLDIHFVEKVRG